MYWRTVLGHEAPDKKPPDKKPPDKKPSVRFTREGALKSSHVYGIRLDGK